ncbi:TonB-linked outer membrane protein, SusC/RagA family [Sphingobacterium spiritivorum]|uniref:TonB-linked outer membrane protein, SusC/RagA family n=1 Tax=Sphingobacterium spiritivorum TaxID=258 RepID=A0A380CNI0_SPHSI|nr:carboxypeptidase-like regulatory domain-containing protein [Sphingobacterium spiritivorum]SUJ24003.1 TonB-linked outer membrane protein, SusC/RagA family [Sphingobacterium spiritivorum]
MTKLRPFLFILFLFTVQYAHSQGNNLIELSGHIIDQESKQPISGVTVLVEGTVNGTSTNDKGDFKLTTRAKIPVQT